jgi:response regulator RpfG family c-di-GMP phosphodiesterase
LNILALYENENEVLGYKRGLESRNHDIIVAKTAEACLKLYQTELQKIFFKTDPVVHIQPFDVVILDCDSCGACGIEVAKEILALNPRQRIILIVTTEVYESIAKSLEGVESSLEILRKPVANKRIIDIIELKEVYLELQKMHLDTNTIRRAKFRYEQLISILKILRNPEEAH